TAVDRFRQKYASEGLSYGGSKKFLLDVMLYTDQNDQVEVLLMLTPDEKAAQSGIGYVDAQKSDVELVPPFRITSLSGSAKKTFLKEVNELYAKIQDVQSHESALLNPVGAMFKVKMKSSGNVGLAPGIYWPSPEDPRIVEVLTLDKDESKQQLVQVLPEDVWYVDRVQFNDKAA
ncbi:hypothetical protein HZC09_02865, partial [Candidatus Micrarchaeota archaeon]|nr:hypothetical protein [Candidatus Micrarchaeota archaeon]